MSIYRYTVTRLCLIEGSLRLQKNILPLFGLLEGEVTMRDEKGTEFSAHVSQKEGKLWGLGEYYKRIGLGVNDVLSLGRLEERKFQLEALIKHARVSSTPNTLMPRPAAPQRVVLGESEFLREVRVERGQFTVPGMPSRELRENKTRKEGAQGARTETPESASELRSPEGSGITEVRADSSRPEPLSVDVGGRRYVPILPQNAPVVVQAQATRNTASSAFNSSTLSSRPSATPPGQTKAQSQAQVQPDFGPLERFATALGYTFRRDGPLAVLEAKLGRQSYRVVLTSAVSTTPDWDALEGIGADYRAVLLSEETSLELPARFKVTRVTVEALETLLESTALSPLTPLELRGYWNAAAIDQDSAQSLSEMAGRELGSRGVFSQVLLCLTEFEPHSSIRVSHLIHRLGERVTRSDLETILDTLTRPPLLAVSRLGEGEYYLRQSVQDTLTLLGDYALGLGARVRVAGVPTQLNGVKHDLLEV